MAYSISGTITGKSWRRTGCITSIIILTELGGCAGGLQGNLLCLSEGGWVSGTSCHRGISLPHCKKKSTRIRGLPFPYTTPHLHDKSPVPRGAAERCAGAFRSLGCQYHNECLCPCHKGRKAKLCKALGAGSGNELTIKTE